MANALVFFGLLAIVGVCFPALLQVVGVTLPAARRAKVRLLSAPRGCIVVGGMLIAVVALPLIVLWSSPSGPLQLAAWLILVLLLGGATIGAAGLAGLIGERMRPSAGAATALGALALRVAPRRCPARLRSCRTVDSEEEHARLEPPPVPARHGRPRRSRRAGRMRERAWTAPHGGAQRVGWSAPASGTANHPRPGDIQGAEPSDLWSWPGRTR